MYLYDGPVSSYAKTMAKPTAQYKARLSKCTTSVLRVCKELNLHPLLLTRDRWRKLRHATEPSHALIQAVGGWDLVKKEAAHLWDGHPPTPGEYVVSYRKDLQITELKETNKALIKQLSGLQDALEVLTELHTQTIKPPAIKAPAKTKSKLRTATAVLLCSDWHVEERVFAEQINGRNEYTPEIATTRVQKLTDGLLWSLMLALLALEQNYVISYIVGAGPIKPITTYIIGIITPSLLKLHLIPEYVQVQFF